MVNGQVPPLDDLAKYLKLFSLAGMDGFIAFTLRNGRTKSQNYFGNLIPTLKLRYMHLAVEAQEIAYWRFLLFTMDSST